MKKLLILMLVFAMASLASAGMLDLMITSQGPVDWDPQGAPVTNPIDPTKVITLQPSEWIDLDIFWISPGIELFTASVDIDVTGPGTLNMDYLTWPQGVWDVGFSQITENVAGKSYTIELVAALFGLPGQVDPVIALDHILFHCDGPGGVLITLTENPTTSTGGSMDFNGDPVELGPAVQVSQVPEPATIALLSLGGLLLRRRK